MVLAILDQTQGLSLLSPRNPRGGTDLSSPVRPIKGRRLIPALIHGSFPKLEESRRQPPKKPEASEKMGYTSSDPRYSEALPGRLPPHEDSLHRAALASPFLVGS